MPPPTPPAASSARPPVPASRWRRSGFALEAHEVSQRFGGLRALDRVSLRVPEGSIVGLIGPNGAGKTTLFDCITGVRPPAEGRVHLFGRVVTEWPAHRRAALGVGRTFQRLELFGSLTVEENVVVAAEAEFGHGGALSDLLALPESVRTREDARDIAASTLELLGLEPHRDEPAGSLPIGLARRVELGRALARYPRLLLLDEPSSGLSAGESASLAELLRGLRDERGTSMLVVEHDMAFVMNLCDHMYVLDFGRLLADGTPDAIRRDPAVRAAYLGEEAVGAGAAGG